MYGWAYVMPFGKYSRAEFNYTNNTKNGQNLGPV